MSKTDLTDEQREHAQEEVRAIYAGAMNKLSHFGLAAMVILFLIYISGILPGKKAPEEIVPLLKEPASVFIEKTGLKTGWSWVYDLNYGDTLSFAAIAFIAAVSIFLFVILTPAFFKRKLNIYGWIAVVQFLVFVLAASGLVSGGH